MKRILSVFICFCLAFCLAVDVMATEEETDSVDFSIQPILPSNQLDRGNTFFDLKVNPEETYTIKVQINNMAQHEQDFLIDVNRAETNGNLIIDYGGETKQKPLENATNIEEWIEYPKKVTIPAEKAGIVSFDIAIPKEGFKGIALGGIQVKKAEYKKKEEGFSTTYDYILGLLLTEDEKDIKPNLEFVSVKPTVIHNNAGLQVEMRNIEPINISDVQMKGHIYTEEDRKHPIITREIKNGGIAPSSSFNINFFNGEAGDTRPLAAGNYYLTLEFADGVNNTWQFEQEFTISKKEAEVVNKEVFTVKQDNKLLYIIIGILTAFLVILLVYLFSKKKAENK